MSAKILVAAGHPKKRLIRALKEVVTQLEEPGTEVTRPDPQFVADLPHVLAHWHAHPRYLEGKEPRALPFEGTGASVAEIIRKVYPQQDPKLVLRALLRSRALRRFGKLYAPTSRDILFRHDLASGRIHALIAWRGLLQTIDHNLSRKGRFLQQTALNSHFPLSALPAFRRRIDVIAKQTLDEFDEYMIRHELPANSREPSALTGLGMFGFAVPNSTLGSNTSSLKRQVVRVRRPKLKT